MTQILENVKVFARQCRQGYDNVFFENSRAKILQENNVNLYTFYHLHFWLLSLSLSTTERKKRFAPAGSILHFRRDNFSREANRKSKINADPVTKW